MKISLTVLVAAVALTPGCTRPPKERPAGSASAPANHPSPKAGIATTPAPPLGIGSAKPAEPVASASPLVASPGDAPSRVGSSAYFGCGEAIPSARLWDETTEAEVLDAIGNAKTCAAQHGRRLLLEFVAPWCEDCQEMAKLDATPVVTAALKRRFERVRINVGKWDRHEALRNNFDVHALATYIVIDPKSSKPLAKTTLEPITKKGQKLSAEAWAAWLETH